MGLWLGSKLGDPVSGASGAEGAKPFEDGGGLGLVERRPWRVCLRWPLMVASEEERCFIALWRVRRPGKVA